MGLPRFILSPAHLRQTPLCLTGAEYRHCRVLRLQPGDLVLLTDGQGNEYQAQLKQWHPQKVELAIQMKTQHQPEPDLPVILYQGMTQSSTFEWVIQKTTELGVTCLVPLYSARSQIHPEAVNPRRLERWQEICRQAARQSGRTRVPEISAPCTFDQSLQRPGENTLSLLLFKGSEPEDAWKKRLPLLPRPQQVALWVGPEGGFTPAEVAEASARGIVPVSLGARSLRSETAGITAVTLALFWWGDLG